MVEHQTLRRDVVGSILDVFSLIMSPVKEISKRDMVHGTNKLLLLLRLMFFSHNTETTKKIFFILVLVNFNFYDLPSFLKITNFHKICDFA